MTLKKTLVLLCTYFVYILPQISWANLLIHPTRVNFQSNERSQILTLANTSNKTNTYQLQWKENVAMPDGGYREMEESEKNSYPLASQFIRFSPRQVTLRAGERQSVKLLLRRARNLEDGEYRSHLLFKALPAAPADDTGPVIAPTMNIDMVINFAIPVALRVGDYNAVVTVEDAEIQYDAINNAGAVFVTLQRRGSHSSYGDMSAFWTPIGGEEILLAKSASHSLWAEIDNYRHKLTWATENFKPTDGSLRIFYEGIKQFKNIDYTNTTYDVKREQIKPPPAPPAQ